MDYIDILFFFPIGYDSKGFNLDPSTSTLRFTFLSPSQKLPFIFSTSPTLGAQIDLSLTISGSNRSSYTLPLLPIPVY